MSSEPFVPDDFRTADPAGDRSFRAGAARPQHNDSDLAAWGSSIEHIRTTPGYPDGSWPPVGGMSSDANLADLTRHAADFEARKGFTFTVLEPGSGEVIGCVYLYPTKVDGHDVDVQSWVRADRADLDVPLADAVAAWLASDWPWERPERHGR